MKIPGGGGGDKWGSKAKVPSVDIFWNYTLRSNPPIPPLFSNSGVGIVYVPQEPDKWKSCEIGRTVIFVLIQEYWKV